MKPNNDIKTIVLELMEKGKQKGMLTYKEIMDAFDEIDIEPEQIEKITKQWKCRGRCGWGY